jgi:hypothetical protein
MAMKKPREEPKPSKEEPKRKPRIHSMPNPGIDPRALMRDIKAIRIIHPRRTS